MDERGSILYPTGQLRPAGASGRAPPRSRPAPAADDDGIISPTPNIRPPEPRSWGPGRAVTLLPGIAVDGSGPGVAQRLVARLAAHRRSLGSLMTPGAGASSAIPCRSTLLREPWEFAYRSVRQSVDVPTDWLGQYLSDWGHLGSSTGASYGLVSSVDDTLDALWASYRSAMRADWAALHGLLGCYNLPRSEIASDYIFFQEGWGAPHKVFLNTLQLVYTFSHYLDYRPLTGDHDCRDFRGFVEALLEGKQAKSANPNNPDICYLRINYPNKGFGYDSGPVHAWCKEPGKADRGCDYKVGSGSRAWDAWEPADWLEGDWCWSGEAGTTTCVGAQTKSDATGTGGRFNVNLHPVTLSFQGWLADQIMWRARVVRDYGLFLLYQCKDVDGLDFLESAKDIARYALRVFVDHGRLVIHELGHCYLGTDHCAHNCCFDVAADAWVCKVRGRLGLPLEVYHPHDDGDYDDATRFHRDDHDACGSEDAFTIWSCDVKEVGEDGQNAEFCSTGCVWTVPDDSVFFEPGTVIDTTAHVVDTETVCTEGEAELAARRRVAGEPEAAGRYAMLKGELLLPGSTALRAGTGATPGCRTSGILVPGPTALRAMRDDEGRGSDDCGCASREVRT